MHLDLVGVLYLMTYLLPALVGGYQLLWFFFVVFKFRMDFFSAQQKMVEIPLAEVTCRAIYKTLCLFVSPSSKTLTLVSFNSKEACYGGIR